MTTKHSAAIVSPPPDQTTDKPLGYRNRALFGAQLLANSLIGYFFSLALARHYGISAEKSGFDIAISLPLMVLTLTGFNFLHGIVLSTFVGLRGRDRHYASRLFSTLLNSLLLASVALIACCAAFSNQLTAWLTGQLPDDVAHSTRLWILTLLPLAALLGIGNLLSAVCNAWRIPLTSEFGLLVPRLLALPAFVWFGDRLSLQGVCLLLLANTVVTVVGQCLLFRACVPLSYCATLDWSLPEFRAMMAQAAPFLLVAMIAQFNAAYVRRAATFEGVHMVAALTFAMTVVQPFVTLLGKTLSYALATRFVAAHGDGRRQVARRLLLVSMGSGLCISVAAGMLLWPWTSELIGLLFEGGRFDAAAVDAVGKIARILLWMAPFAVLSWISYVPSLGSGRRHASALIYGLGSLGQMLFMTLSWPLLGGSAVAWGFVVGHGIQGTCSALVALEACRQPVKEENRPAYRNAA